MSVVEIGAAATPVALPPEPDRSIVSILAVRFARALLIVVVSAAVALGVWIAFLKLFHLNPYFARSPSDVWKWLTSGPDAHAHRHLIWTNLQTTLGDAMLGYVAGTIAAVAAAAAFVMSRSVERSLMPIALALRTVPLVAMTPLITLVFGRGKMGVTIIAGIVTFFPTLVNMVQGLRSAPSDTLLLMRACDASPLTTLRKVQLPSALPSLFASAKIAAPGAMLGAVLAEWLATGKGLGYLMLTAPSTSNFDALWAAVVTITLVAVAVYAAIGFVETPVIARFGNPARAR